MLFPFMQAQAFVSQRLLQEKLGWEDERIQRALVNMFLIFLPNMSYILSLRNKNLVQEQDRHLEQTNLLSLKFAKMPLNAMELYCSLNYLTVLKYLSDSLYLWRLAE